MKTIKVTREGRPATTEELEAAVAGKPLPLKYITRVTRLTIMPPGEPICSERATQITIEDEAAGEFVKIEQQFDSAAAERQTITIDPGEWPHLKATVETLLFEIDKHEIP